MLLEPQTLTFQPREVLAEQPMLREVLAEQPMLREVLANELDVTTPSVFADFELPNGFIARRVVIEVKAHNAPDVAVVCSEVYLLPTGFLRVVIRAGRWLDGGERLQVRVSLSDEYEGE